MRQLYCEEKVSRSGSGVAKTEQRASSQTPRNECAALPPQSRNSSQSGRNALRDITNQPDKMPQWNLNEKMYDFPPSVTARCWVLYDVQNAKYLEGKSPYTQRQVASLTKIMTFYTTLRIFENLKIENYLDFQFRVTKYASSMNGTSARLLENSWIRVRDLFYALMLPSGNDAAIVLAENMGNLLQLEKKMDREGTLLVLQDRDNFYEYLMNSRYPIYSFLNEMNKNARGLNMCLTNYANPHGKIPSPPPRAISPKRLQIKDIGELRVGNISGSSTDMYDYSR